MIKIGGGDEFILTYREWTNETYAYQRALGRDDGNLYRTNKESPGFLR